MQLCTVPKSLLNPVIQLQVLFYSILTNLGIPLAIGFEEFGKFVLITSGVLLAARLCEATYDTYVLNVVNDKGDIAFDFVIRDALIKKSVASLALGSILATIFAKGYLVLPLLFLSAITIQQFLFSCLYAFDNRMDILKIYFVMIAGVIFLLTIGYVYEMSGETFVWLMTGHNFVAAAVAFYFLPHLKSNSYKPVFTTRRQVAFATMALSPNLINTGIVTIAGLVLNPTALGVVRFSISTVKASVSLFPINPRTVFVRAISENSTSSQVALKNGVLFIIFVLFVPVLFIPSIIDIFGKHSSFFFDEDISHLIRWQISLFSPSLSMFVWVTINERLILAYGGEKKATRVNYVTAPLILICSFVFIQFSEFGVALSVFCCCTIFVLTSQVLVLSNTGRFPSSEIFLFGTIVFLSALNFLLYGLVLLFSQALIYSALLMVFWRQHFSVAKSLIFQKRFNIF